MKKIISLVMFVLMLATVLSACNLLEISSNDVSTHNNVPISYDTMVSDEVIDYRFSKADGVVDFILGKDDLSDAQDSPSARVTPSAEASFAYMTFEEAITEFASDVVIAQYKGSRPFGTSLIEAEFIVLDRILGYAGDRIFVYSENNVSAGIFGTELSVAYMPGNLEFSNGTTYMLPLIRVSRAHTNIQDEGFVFIRDIVINLDNPTMSVMYSEELSRHSTHLDFDTLSNARGMDINSFLVSYVNDLTRHNTPSRGIIKSNEIEDVLNESPYVFLVEIGEPLRLSHEQHNTDLMATDLYFITIIRELKGNAVITYDTVMIFVADTVSQGQQYIVAVEPIIEGSSWFQLTSRNSLFQMGQTAEILRLLNNL